MGRHGADAETMAQAIPGRSSAVKANFNTLIMGASYGSLLAAKLALAGHDAKLVCLSAEVEAINKDGIRVRLPIKGRTDLLEIHSRNLPGKVSAGAPGASNVLQRLEPAADPSATTQAKEGYTK